MIDFKEYKEKREWQTEKENMTRLTRATQLEQEIDNIDFEAVLRARLSRDFPEQFVGNGNKSERKLQARYDTEQLRSANAMFEKLDTLAVDAISCDE